MCAFPAYHFARRSFLTLHLLLRFPDSDNNPRVASLPYEEASGGREINPDDDKPIAKVVSEKVDNVSGSSAGAGSGDFHTYRHARRREFFRLAKIEEAAKTEELDEQVGKTACYLFDRYRA
jgi:hypothetical protein